MRILVRDGVAVSVSLTSRALLTQFGEVPYTTCRTVQGNRVIDFHGHAERLGRSFEALVHHSIPISSIETQMKDIIVKGIAYGARPEAEQPRSTDYRVSLVAVKGDGEETSYMFESEQNKI